ncbi:hypothetical protein KBY58_01635 [Cyanobium sp. HWJ4-Hawea]|uniref:hypothetical protein n=1 Tax=unclassified Cyanobium TaxID=2627006 RepID=UPI0020CBDFDB|nr:MULTISPECIES: hypothetical protein [unclassified Cyanobium]MCP9775536.1 hypothetical protein [Cyanobium sp. WAJ14-Wanaka]MCP9808134.1 hypothetical protein [Cyanobium sp. HWJ4-Hawea]
MRQVLQLWALALALSVVLVAAGDRWPEPLQLQPLLVWGLVLAPPALMGIWLLSRWRIDGKGESEN